MGSAPCINIEVDIRENIPDFLRKVANSIGGKLSIFGGQEDDEVTNAEIYVGLEDPFSVMWTKEGNIEYGEYTANIQGLSVLIHWTSYYDVDAVVFKEYFQEAEKMYEYIKKEFPDKEKRFYVFTATL